MKINQTGNSAGTGSDVGGIEKDSRASKLAEIKAKIAQQNGGSVKANESLASPEISNRAKELAKARDVAANSPDIREDRVAELKRQIASGEYNVDADALAGKILNEHATTQGIA